MSTNNPDNMRGKVRPIAQAPFRGEWTPFMDEATRKLTSELCAEAITQGSGAMARLRQLREHVANMKEWQSNAEQAMLRRLVDLLPEDCHEFFDPLARLLVEEGFTSGHVFSDDAEDSGFRDFADLKDKIRRAAKAWEGLVIIYAGKTRGKDEYKITCVSE